MPLPSEFVHWCEAEIAMLREQLEQLMSGGAEAGRRPQGSAWTDNTAEEVQRLKRAIANLEAVLAKSEGAQNPNP
jgi:hypothetical protein